MVLLMANEFELRPATIDDAEAIAGLIISFQRDLTDHPDGRGAEEFLASVAAVAQRSYLASDRYSYTVAEYGLRLVGIIAMRDRTHLFHLFVAREHQRRGLARRLWMVAKKALASDGDVGVFTVNASLSAVPVYRSFGFVSCGDPISQHGISFLPMTLCADQLKEAV